jgi:hydrogenase maturation protease
MTGERLLILGIGNLLLGDEGVGVHIVRALQAEDLPPNTVALEVGTAFLDSIHEIEKADRIIVIDAMQAGRAPGTVYRVPFEECAVPQRIASVHGFDLSRALFLAGRTSFPKVVVFGVEPARIDWGIAVSPEIQNALPNAVAAIKAEIAGTPVSA